MCAVLMQPSPTCAGYPIVSRLIVVVGNVAHTTFAVVNLSRGVCSFPGTFCWSGTASVLASLCSNTWGLVLRAFWLLFVPTPEGCFPFHLLALFSAFYFSFCSVFLARSSAFFLCSSFFVSSLSFFFFSFISAPSCFFSLSPSISQKQHNLLINEPEVALLFDQWELTLEEGSGTLRVSTLMECFLCCYLCQEGESQQQSLRQEWHLKSDGGAICLMMHLFGAL